VVIFADVSGQPIDPIFKGKENAFFLTLEVGINRLSRNVGKKLPLLAA
jgi:hypothetical protein